MERFVDPRTDNGEGTYIGAAQIRFNSEKDADNQFEIGDFGTFPGKLIGVIRRGRRLPWRLESTKYSSRENHLHHLGQCPVSSRATAHRQRLIV